MNCDFLSCDWGTTSFRLRWVRGTDGEVLRQIRNLGGVKSLFAEAVGKGATTPKLRAQHFARFFLEQLDLISREVQIPSTPLPIVISGMASSSVGWLELPYARAPFNLDGSGLLTAQLSDWCKPGWVGATWLISGIATQEEIMRGEEIEIIGILSDPRRAPLRDGCILILPGTHSKHVRIRNGHAEDFSTAMTGELFEVLCQHSLLKASVDPTSITFASGVDSIGTAEKAAFRDGVSRSKTHALATNLFRVRTRSVLDKRAPSENGWFLSGLLIGAELSALNPRPEDGPLVVAANPALSAWYGMALDVLFGTSVRWQCLPPEVVDYAVVAGHAVFLNNLSSRP